MQLIYNRALALILVGFLSLQVGCDTQVQSPPATSSAPDPSANSQTKRAHSEVAFTTYQSRDNFRLAFLSPSKVRKTWANMGGDAVIGQYRQDGKQITITWDAGATLFCPIALGAT
jgi:hypothetical protein